MALGQLVVRLGLDAAEFIRGMTKAEVKAQQFRKNLEGQVASARGVALGFAAIGAAAGTAFAAVDRLVKNAAQFKDIEERAGGTAESFASIAVAAATAGVGMADVESASIKLTKAISGLDEESKSAVKALAAIGLPFEEFKRLDPVGQLQAVAKALAGFADGTGKTAVAVALFGKAGAQQLTLLRELAQEGGRQVTLTQAQIDAADKYADAQAKASAQIKLYAQSVATEAIPAIGALGETFRNFVRELSDVEKAGQGFLTLRNLVKVFADVIVVYIGAAITTIQILGRVFEGTILTIGAGFRQIGAIAQGEIRQAIQIGRDLQAELSKLGSKPLFFQQLEQELKASTFPDIPQRRDSEPRNQIKFKTNVKEVVDKAKRELESLRDFVDRLGRQGLGDAIGLDDRTITDLERLDEAFKRGVVTLQRRNDLIDVILNNDTKLRQEQEKLNKIYEDWLELQRKGIESADDLIQGLRDEAAAVGLNASQLAALNVQLKIRDAIKGVTDPTAIARIVAIGEEARALAVTTVARKEAADAALRGLAAGKDLVQRYQDEAGALGKTGIELELYRIGLEKVNALLGVTDRTQREHIETLFETAAALAVNNDAQRKFVEDSIALNDAFRSSFAENIAAVADGTKSFKDAVKDMAKSWTKALNDMAAKKLGEALFGPQGSTGGGFLPDFGKLFSGLFNTGSLGKEPKAQVDPSAALSTVASASASTGAELLALTAATTSSAAGFTALTTATTSTSAALSAAATSTSAGLTALNAAAATTTPPLVLLATNAGLAASALLQVSNSSALGGLFGGSDPFGIGGWARGGPMAANQPGWVGEHGKELFVPKVSGQIIPNHELSKTLGGVTNNLKIDVNVAGNTSRQSATQIATEVGIRVQRALARNT